MSEASRAVSAIVLAAAISAAACAGSAKTNLAVPATSAGSPPAPGAASAAADSLGPRPEPKPPVPFVPPAPQVLEGPAGSKVWLLERHGLPIVTIALVVPYGSAAEPMEKGGLAFATADMLDEGAGDRDALAFSQAVNDLGAKLASSADRDSSVVSLEVLVAKLDQALPLLADAVVRPRHENKDWTRVRTLWNNALKNRAHEPNDVARVVTSVVYYGPKHPYAHPPDGTLTSAKSVLLPDISKWHKAIWRPDAATFVVVGDVKPEGITASLKKAFAAWKVPASAAAPVVPPGPISNSGVRTYVVDRSDAPQVVLSFARSGPPASDPAFPRLGMLNVALGGSFTSRLNQNLREDHGWTYGVRSRFNAQRGAGMFVVRAAIRADAIAPALRETKKELEKMAAGGLAEGEIDKVRALLNGEALETYGALHGVAGSLASNAALGLPPDQDAKDLASQRSATPKDLSTLASAYLELSSATLILVGPKDAAIKALADNGLPKPELVDAEGRPVAR